MSQRVRTVAHRTVHKRGMSLVRGTVKAYEMNRVVVLLFLPVNLIGNSDWYIKSCILDL